MTEQTTTAPALSRRSLLAGAGVHRRRPRRHGVRRRHQRPRGSSGPSATIGGAAGAPADADAPAYRGWHRPPRTCTIAQLAAGLEVLAVGTYKARSTPPPPASSATFRRRWPSSSRRHGAPPGAPRRLERRADEQRCRRSDEPERDAQADRRHRRSPQSPTSAAPPSLALMLEQIAAATYLSAQGVLTDKDAIDARRLDPDRRRTARRRAAVRARRVPGARTRSPRSTWRPLRRALPLPVRWTTAAGCPARSSNSATRSQHEARRFPAAGLVASRLDLAASTRGLDSDSRRVRRPVSSVPLAALSEAFARTEILVQWRLNHASCG